MINISKLQTAIKNLNSDLTKVHGSKSATADVLVMFSRELDKALQDIVRQADGDAAMFENSCFMSMEAAMMEVLCEVQDATDSWRLFDEGIDIYAK
jgi:hypothetical protein